LRWIGFASNLGVEVRNRQCRALTARAVIGGETVLLAKPETYMNLSGMSVRSWWRSTSEAGIRFDRDSDELDFPLARCGFILGEFGGA